MSPDPRTSRALRSLDGLSTGDAFGEQFFAIATDPQSLHRGLSVPHTLDLRGCTGLTGLPPGMRVGFGLPRLDGRGRQWVGQTFTPALRLADCAALTELPDDLELGGPVEVAGSGQRDLAESLAGARALWRGVLVPPEVVFHPERIDPLDVLRQPNAELRRVMLEQLGPARVLGAVGAKARDRDADAGGPRQLLLVPRLNHCYLLCRCPSTGREYLLRVPPGTATCRQAAAWIAGFDDPNRYNPAVET